MAHLNISSKTDENSFTEQEVIWIKQHTPKLISFAVSRPEHFHFRAGQFVKLGFFDGNEYVWRAYSMISGEQDAQLCFYAILIENGVMSAHFAQMQVGARLLVDNKAVGFFTADRIPHGKQIVMLATGSGIAPFLSILTRPDLWQKAEQMVLVHSVSHSADLVFEQHLKALLARPELQSAAQKFIYQPVITREPEAQLHQRIPTLLANGELSQALSFSFTPAETRFLICGNPNMVKESYDYLKGQGFNLHRIHKDGEIMMENAF